MKTIPTTYAPASPVTTAVNLVEDHRAHIPGMRLAPDFVPQIQGNMRILAFNRQADDSRWALMLDVDQNTLMVTDGTNIQDAGTPDSPVICACCGGRDFIVMTHAGPLTVYRNRYGGWTYYTHGLDYGGGISFSTVQVGTTVESTPDVTLSGISLPRDGGLLSGSKIDMLGRQLIEAYDTAVTRANKSTYWSQPAMLRFHLYNKHSQRVYTSPPTMVELDGWAAVKPFTVECSKDADGNLQVPPISVSIPIFNIRLSIPTMAHWVFAQNGITSIQVTCVPVLHPVDDSADTTCRVVHTSSPTPALTIAIPGVTDRFEDLTVQRSETMLQLASRFDQCEISLGTFIIRDCPEKIRIVHPVTLSRQQESEAVSHALASDIEVSKSTDSGSSLIDRLSPPNSFSANAVSVDSDIVTWGCITPLRYAGADPALMCDMFDENESWRGVIQITRSDSSHSVVEVSGAERPLRLAACVAIRDPLATSVSIFTTSASGTFMASATLSPTPDNRFAARIDMDQDRRLFSPFPGSLPTPTDPWIPEDQIPGLLIAARSDAPLIPFATSHCCEAAISAILPATRGQSSWDFSRHHIYVFSPAGIYGVSINQSSGAISSSLIDPRGVHNPQRVCFTPSGVVALTESQLLQLRGSKVQTLLHSSQYDAVAWHPPLNSLLLRDPRGNLTMLSLDTMHSCLLSLPRDILHLSSHPPLLWASSPSELLVPREPMPDDPPRPVIWLWHSDSVPPQPFHSVCLDLSATEFHGHVKIYGSSWPRADTDLPPGQLLASIAVDGSVNAPLFIRLPIPWRQFITIELSADVSSDFFFRSITLN